MKKIKMKMKVEKKREQEDTDSGMLVAFGVSRKEKKSEELPDRSERSIFFFVPERKGLYYDRSSCISTVWLDTGLYWLWFLNFLALIPFGRDLSLKGKVIARIIPSFLT
jgi:hypothetical protein